MTRRGSSRIAVAALALLAVGCGGGKGDRATGPAPGTPATISLTSPAFAEGAILPRRFTCDAEGQAPPLSWSGVPAGARELALVVEDPDVPGGAFVHWVVLALGPRSTGLPAGTRPATLRQGKGSSGKVGYEPPCPPQGASPHRYFFTLYALREPLGLADGASAAGALRAIAPRSVGLGRLTARYGR